MAAAVAVLPAVARRPAVAAELVDGAVDGTRAGAHDHNPKTTTPPRALHTELLRVVALLEHRDAPAKS